MNIKVKEISEENFKLFGKVLAAAEGNPTSQSQSYKFWSDIINYKIDGETEVGICNVYKQPENLIEEMERHLRTPEILIPIDAPFVLPLLSTEAGSEKVEAFKVGVGQALKIDDAVWHGPCIPADKKECSYFVIFRRGTPQEDVEKKKIQKVKIEI
ncbi:MAG: ureidoglycolate lyase [Ignavibacteriaceae bacterium]